MRGDEPKTGATADPEDLERSRNESAVGAADVDESYAVEVESASMPRPPSDGGSDLTEVADASQPSSPGNIRARRSTEPGRVGKRPITRAGQVLGGRYRIEREIAKGGMGRVYLATQVPLGRPVAIKVLNPDFQKTDPQFVRRFCLEAAISARLSHPNVITIHDYGEAENGDIYMAMEYLDGDPLSRVIAREAPLAADRVLHISIQICRALREAHDKGVIHRDLKPGNVMIVTSGEDPHFVKVLDFGLVKLFQKDGEAPSELGRLDGDPEAEGDLTRAGTLLGSPRYMSPEQIRGDTLDPRTDIYSLGVIMYQMVTGHAPFSGKTSVDVIYKHMNHAVPKIEAADCPPPLEHVILRCLEKDRAKRHDSMADLLRGLKDAQRLITGNSVATDSIPIGGAHARAFSNLPEPVVETPREAAFRDRDITDDSAPSGAMRRPNKVPPARRLQAVLAALTGITALVALALWANRPDPPPPASPPPPIVAPAVTLIPPPPPPADALIRLESTPSDAVVLEGEDVLGKTPLELRLPIGEAERRFTFRKAGFKDLTITRRVEGEAVVAAALESLPTPPLEPPVVRKRPSKKKGEDEGDDDEAKKRPAYYRDNPY